jgi:large repetitive protein
MTPRSQPRLAGVPAALTLALALALALASAAQAQPVHRVVDLSSGVLRSGDSAPLEFTLAGGVYYFSADDGVHGRELWRTGGTPASTHLVADLCPGPCGSQPQALTALGGALVFTAADGVTGREPWRSDGTDAGTTLLRDVCPGPCASVSDEPMVAFDGRIYFGAVEGATASGLWATDGTAAGTAPVASGFAPASGGLPHALTPFAGRLFFAAGDAAGVELWASDGTAAGTARVADVCPGACGSYPMLPAVSGDDLFFVAVEPDHGEELWASDGSEGGTRLVADLNPGPQDTLIQSVTPFAGEVYLTAYTCPLRPCAWHSDGTPAGTVQAVELAPAGSNVAVQDLTPVGETLYYSLLSLSQATEDLWTLSGSPPVRHLVAAGFGVLSNLTPFGAGALFIATHESPRERLWSSDGTAAGTAPLGPESGAGSTIDAFAGRAFFTVTDDATGSEPWVTDGTPAGTFALGDLWPILFKSSQLMLPRALGDRLLFAPTAPGISGLWSSDGTAAGTVPVLADAHVREAAVAGDRLFAAADPPPDGTGLWVTDGSAAGTVALAGVRGAELTAVGDRVFFREESGAGQRLWTSDGIVAGTRLVVDVNPIYSTACPSVPPGCVPPPPFPSSLAAVGDRLYFAAFEDASTAQLWTSDGTPAGTAAVRSFAVGEGKAGEEPPRELTPFAGGLLFSAFEEDAGREPWFSDGTAAGTVRLADLAPGPASSSPRDFTLAGGAAFFVTGEPAAGETLWRLAAAGFTLAPIHDFPAGSFVAATAAAGDRLYLTVFDPATGAELWSSDGTPAGAALVRDLFAGPRGASPRALTAVDGRLVFAADDGFHGLEPWVTDGTAAGTFLLADVFPGPRPSAASGFTVAGPAVYFFADDGASGRELWLADRDLVTHGGGATSCEPDATTLCLGGGRFKVEVDWATQFGTSGPAQVVPFGSDDSGLFYFFNPDNWEILVKVLDGCGVNDHWWVFFAATTNVQFELRVTDTSTGEVVPYTNPLGHRADAVTDTAAFATCP